MLLHIQVLWWIKEKEWALLPLEKAEWCSKLIFFFLALSTSYGIVARIPEESTEAWWQTLSSGEVHLDASAGPDWAPVPNVLDYHAVGHVLPALACPIHSYCIWPLRYSHYSQLVPLAGWGCPISAKVRLVFEYQPRKCLLKVSASDFIKILHKMSTHSEGNV